MSLLAHISGMPVEELLPLMPGIGAMWLALMAKLNQRRTR